MRAAALVVVLALLASRAAAQNVDVARAEPRAVLSALSDEVLYARYDQAIGDARTFLARTDLDAHDRNGGLEKLAIAQIANGTDADARATLAILYGRDPQHRLDDADASPRVQSAFARVRDSHPHAVVVRLEHTPQAPLTHESPLVSVVVAEGADAVEDVQLDFRSPGDTRYTRVVMAYDHGVARARIPVGGDPTVEQSIEYYLEAVAPSQVPLAHVGSEAVPLTVTVPAEAPRTVVTVNPETGATEPDTSVTPARVAEHDTTITNETPWQVPHIGDHTVREGESAPSHSVADEWWFWTLIGVAVLAGAATGIYFAVGPPSQPAPSGSLGWLMLH